MAPALLSRPAMVDPIFQSENYLIARQLLDASVLRHQAIASNIANSETPGYRRLDISTDFASELRAKVEAGDLKNASTSLRPTVTQDLTARSVRPDGNSVELERELLEMNRNSVEHDFLTELVSRNIKQLKPAITGRGV